MIATMERRKKRFIENDMNLLNIEQQQSDYIFLILCGLFFFCLYIFVVDDERVWEHLSTNNKLTLVRRFEIVMW